MPYKRIELLLQACCNFICIVIILKQMKFYTFRTPLGIILYSKTTWYEE